MNKATVELINKNPALKKPLKLKFLLSISKKEKIQLFFKKKKI